MTLDDAALVAAVNAAFRERKIPGDRIIHHAVDLSQHTEAQNIDKYFRENKAVKDRKSAVLAAFYYLSSEAALWVVPFYINSIVLCYKKDDFIIDVISEALSRGILEENSGYNPKLALEMKALASVQEAAAICSFFRWLLLKFSKDDIEERAVAALKLWCADR